MKRMWWLLVVVLLTLTSCADVIKEAEQTMIAVDKIPMIVYNVDPEAEEILFEAMYTSPVEWNTYDLEKVVLARGTLKMADEYLDNKAKNQGGITYFTLSEFLDFVTYAFTVYEEGADGRAAQSGNVTDIRGDEKYVDVLTRQEKWIYARVKEDVWHNLRALRAYVNTVSDDINKKVDERTIDRFKQAYQIIESIVPANLPIDVL